MRMNQMAADSVRKASAFRLRAQMLEQGRTDTEIVRTDNMWVRLKVYASGGENVLHAHPVEDHLFVILQGRATFYDADGTATELDMNQGIILPAKTYYWFSATGEEPLVLLRVGSRTAEENRGITRVDIRGEPLHGESAENNEVPVVFRDNVYFG